MTGWPHAVMSALVALASVVALSVVLALLADVEPAPWPESERVIAGSEP